MFSGIKKLIFGGGSDVQVTGETTLDAVLTDKMDLKNLKGQMVYNMHDVSLLGESDWDIIGVSSAGKALLKEKLSQMEPAAPSGAGGLAALVTDKKELKKLTDQMITTLEDVRMLSEEDWKTIKLKGETRKILEKAAGVSSSAFAASAVTDETGVEVFVTNKSDIAKLEKEWLFTLGDVKRMEPQHWKSLGLSPASESALKAALETPSAPALPSGVGAQSLDTPVSSIISNAADLKKLEGEWIFTLADVDKLSPADFATLNLTPESSSALKAACGATDVAVATQTLGLGEGDDTPISSIVANSADKAKLDAEWIFTLADIKKLSPSDWASIGLSPASMTALQAACGSGASAPTPSMGGASDDTPIANIVSNPSDRAKLENEWIFTLGDVAKLSPSDWAALGLSPATQSALQAACGLGAAAPAPSYTPASAVGVKAGGNLAELVSNPKDLAILNAEWLFSTDDIEMLNPDDWRRLTNEMGLSMQTYALLSGGAAPAGSAPYMSAPFAASAARDLDMSTPMLVKDIITDPAEFQKLKAQWVLSMKDVARLSPEDWKKIGVSAATQLTLQSAMGQGVGSKAGKYEKTVNSKVRKLKLMKQRIRELDKAIAAAHKLALEAEVKAIQAADNLCSLQERKIQIKRLRY